MKTTSLILFERSRILVITRKKYVAIIFVLLLGSCKVYSPRIIPIHQFKGKDDVFISGNITIPTGISGSVAYSPFSHSSIQVHMAVAPEASYYFQGTTGAYWGNGSSTNFEILAGYGNGKGKAIKSPNPAFLKVNTIFTLPSSTSGNPSKNGKR